MNPDKLAEKIIKETKRKDYQHVVYEVVDYLYLNNYLTDPDSSQLEPLVSLKLADILKVLNDEEYTVSVFSNDTVDDKISESIANTAVIDFKKQLRNELIS